MTEERMDFPYAELIKSLPFIAFVRTKNTQGQYSYDFPFHQDKEHLDISPFDQMTTDENGCLDIVEWSDKKQFMQSIRDSEQNMTMSKENFCVLLPSGERRWLTGSALPEKQENGDIVWKGLWLDITEEKRKNYFNSLVLESVHEGIAAFDSQGNILFFSPSLTSILSYTAEEINKKTIFSLLPSDISETLQQYMLLSALKDKISIEVSIERNESRPVFLEIDMFQKDFFFICLFRDVTRYHEKEEQFRYLAYHDVNTGVKNYTYLDDVFSKSINQAKISQTQIAVLSVTPDSMGQVDAVSDPVIRAHIMASIANRISSCLSGQDYLAQTGYCHFTVLVTGLEFALGVEKKVESILHSFDKPIYVNELEFDLTVSIGICFSPQDGEILPDLIAKSDMALNQIRCDEKSSMRVYNSDLAISTAISMNMRRDLKKAIENNEISAFFQPQVDIRTGHIVGLEALARWHTSDGILIPPSEFIPEAEECGMIDALTEIILDQACKWNQKWHSMGLCRVPVSVNISGRQFHNESQLLCLIDKALEESDLPPYLLELELTESSAMLDPDNARKVIQTLLDNNIRCALDDFGTGYSSLSVLSSFPLKKLKIDRSFVLSLNEKKNVEIVRATIVMAHALNLPVLAEGVENRRNFEVLKNLGCDIIQGYLFSRPLSAEQMELMLMRWDADIAAMGESL